MVNAWYVSFRIWRVEVSEARPHGIRYSFTLHDELSARHLGFMTAVGEACRSENVEFLFVEKERELGEDVGDGDSDED